MIKIKLGKQSYVFLMSSLAGSTYVTLREYDQLGCVHQSYDRKITTFSSTPPERITAVYLELAGSVNDKEHAKLLTLEIKELFSL